jgi:hypothetical protein
MRKSSNKQDSRLCSIVVRTTPPSHAAATQAQVTPAAADAPAFSNFTSVATAPAAASDSSITEFTEYDVDMIWDRVFAANAVDLSLHKPHSELNSAEKTAWKTAKKTRG